MGDVRRIKLKADDFDTLTSGGVVSRDGVEIILADIGYMLMIRILEEKRDKMIKEKRDRMIKE